MTSVADPLLQTLSLIFNSLPTPFGLYTLDSSCGCWTVLPAGCCLPSPLLHNYLWGSVPMHIHTQLPNPRLCQNHRIPTVWGQKGSHWLCPNTKWLMSPFRTWRLLAKSYEFGIQRKPALQPSMFKLESSELQGSHRDTSMVTPASRKGDKQDGL